MANLTADRRNRVRTALARLTERIRWILPEGGTLPEAVWQRRHQVVLWLLWLHAIGIFSFVVLTGWGLIHALVEGGVVALIAGLAGLNLGSRRFRGTVASLGLLTCSAILVHLSGGYIELHFHFFVMLGVISLYQDWPPFLMAIGYVVLHHGLVGVLFPTDVYNHPDAWAHPWKWAAIHGGFVLAASAANIVAWRFNESLRSQSEAILNSAGEGIIGLDQTGVTRFVNPAAAQMLGYTAPEMIQQPLHHVLRRLSSNGEVGRVGDYPLYAPIQQGVVYRMTEDLFCRKNGLQFPAECVSTPLQERGALVGAVVTLRDISERKQVELEVQQANDRLRALINELEQRNREISLVSAMDELLQACTTEKEISGVVARFAQQLLPGAFGAVYMYSASRNDLEMITAWGDFPVEPMKLFAPDECWALRRGRVHRTEAGAPALACQHLTGASPVDGLCVPMLAQGELLGVFHLQFRPGRLVSSGDAHAPSDQAEAPGEQARLALTIAEHASLSLANIKLRETLRSQSIRDPLTGLFNRRYLEETLERELRRATRNQHPVGIIMLDLDHFKAFNDTFGHEAGDLVLRELGQLLKARSRGADIACRYGGEEFALILPEAAAEATQQRAEILRSEIQHLNLHLDGQPLGPVTLSLGVAVFPEYGLTPDLLLRAADRALYRAKQAGRDQVRLAEM